MKDVQEADAFFQTHNVGSTPFPFPKDLFLKVSACSSVFQCILVGMRFYRRGLFSLSGTTNDRSATPPVPSVQLKNEHLQPIIIDSHTSTSSGKLDENRQTSGSASSTGSLAKAENNEPEPVRISLDDAWKSVTESKPTLGVNIHV